MLAKSLVQHFEEESAKQQSETITQTILQVHLVSGITEIITVNDFLLGKLAQNETQALII